MSTEDYQKVQSAYSFFQKHQGQDIKLVDIACATGWKESTISTYFNKKWKDIVLSRVKKGVYQVCMPSDMSLTDFGALHSQVDEHLR